MSSTAQEGWPRAALWLTVGTAGAVGLLLLYQGIHLGLFHTYEGTDDAIYYGEGFLLTHGVLPYRAYLDVQPPGIALLMAPFGLLGRLTSERVGFEVARVAIVSVAVGNVLLMGRLVRRRHWLDVLVCVAVLAFYHGSIYAESSVLLEPFLVFGTLIALLLLFDDSEHATRSAAHWLAAGVVLGMTTSIKLFGVFPLVVLAIVAATLGAKYVVRFLVAAVGGFAAVSGVFFVAAPAQFWRDVVQIQVTRSDVGSTPTALRLGEIADLGGIRQLGLAVAPWCILLLVVGGSVYFAKRRPTQLDLCAMACLVLLITALLLSSIFNTQYCGFVAPFLALVLGATVGRLRLLVKNDPALVTLVIGFMALFVVFSVGNVVGQAEQPFPLAENGFSPHACVIADRYASLLLDDRYNLYEPQCPHVLDTFGYQLLDGASADASASPKLQADWLSWVQRADGLDLSFSAANDPVLGPAVRAYIQSHFRYVTNADGRYLYQRN